MAKRNCAGKKPFSRFYSHYCHSHVDMLKSVFTLALETTKPNENEWNVWIRQMTSIHKLQIFFCIAFCFWEVEIVHLNFPFLYGQHFFSALTAFNFWFQWRSFFCLFRYSQLFIRTVVGQHILMMDKKWKLTACVVCNVHIILLRKRSKMLPMYYANMSDENKNTKNNTIAVKLIPPLHTLLE